MSPSSSSRHSPSSPPSSAKSVLFPHGTPPLSDSAAHAAAAAAASMVVNSLHYPSPTTAMQSGHHGDIFAHMVYAFHCIVKSSKGNQDPNKGL